MYARSSTRGWGHTHLLVLLGVLFVALFVSNTMQCVALLSLLGFECVRHARRRAAMVYDVSGCAELRISRL